MLITLNAFHVVEQFLNSTQTHARTRLNERGERENRERERETEIGRIKQYFNWEWARFYKYLNYITPKNTDSAGRVQEPNA